MAQGRKPLPSNLKLVKGTVRKSRTNKEEPKPIATTVEKPEGMSPLAEQHWDIVAKQLSDCGILTTLDTTALMMYCEVYATWRDATNKVHKSGVIIKGEAGTPVRSPYLLVAQKTFDQMRSMLTEFGMTPSSRTKVKATPIEQKSSDPWDEF